MIAAHVSSPFPSAIELRSTLPESRWNFRAAAPSIVFSYDAATSVAVATDRDGRERFRSDDPFAALRWMSAYDLSATPGARWIGYIGYEFARQIEVLPATTRDDLGLPTFVFALCEPSAEPTTPRQPSDVASRLASRSLSPPAYLAAVQRAIDYIAAGDIFQVNFAQRLTFETSAGAATLWQRLVPQAFDARLDFERFAILSNSPELFFRIDARPDGSRRIVNRPIKGTRPNRPGMFDELSHSAKERAELAMIVDLQRNDLGRVCEIGSVVVREPRVIEQTPTVYHGVATIDGTLRSDAGFADVVRALFPCGSITGCPKIRAMQIIDELEPVARGPYCGAIGYLAADGSAEFNVAIRTMVLKDGLAHVAVGGGIVADSTPEAEYDETLVKARAMLEALGANVKDEG